jgi:Na+-driven multidrug efflux pump
MPEMGIAGAALASSIAEAIAFLCYLIFTVKYINFRKYGFDTVSAVFSPSILKRVFTVSFWMMLQPFISVGVWFFFFIAVERLGERSLAVINLIRTLSAMPFIIIQGFATSANSLVSNLIGENKSDQVWRLIRKIMLSSFAAVVPLLILYAVFPKMFLRIYTDNTELIAASVNVIYIMCIASFLQIGAFILFNAVSGTGSIKTTVFIEFTSLFVYVVYVWLFIIRAADTSPSIAWASEILYQFTIGIIGFLFLLSGKWKNKKL